MATPSRRTGVDLRTQLAREPYRFEFVQAVRLLERAGLQSGRRRGGQPVGGDESPRDEVVRFHSLVSLAFPSGDIAGLTLPDGDEPTPSQMTVSFLGLTGPAGVMPQHYTQLLINRVRDKDYSLRDFLDVFHHRLISLFYRAWRKYRFVVGYERAAETKQVDDDCFTGCLFSLVGMGTKGLRERQEVDDEALLYYAGHFAHEPRSAMALEGIVADYLELPAQVKQFIGQWLYLSTEDRSSLPSPLGLGQSNNVLGRNVVVGDRVWGIENRVRVAVGPLSYRHFMRFSPRGDRLRQLAQLVRSFVGVEFDFDVQPILRAEEVPALRLGGDAYLGWNTWLTTRPLPRDAEDAVFAHEGWSA